jgi:drug/metabolite transporter (DMT)-like permease
MAYVNGIVCAILAVFAIAQYNDPDGLLWFLIYAIPAAWAGAVAFRPDLLPSTPPAILAYLACLGAAIAGTLYMWPALPDDWIHVEEEREGIGLIIVTAALIVTGCSWWRQARHRSPGAAAI